MNVTVVYLNFFFVLLTSLGQLESNVIFLSRKNEREIRVSGRAEHTHITYILSGFSFSKITVDDYYNITSATLLFLSFFISNPLAKFKVVCIVYTNRVYMSISSFAAIMYHFRFNLIEKKLV